MAIILDIVEFGIICIMFWMNFELYKIIDKDQKKYIDLLEKMCKSIDWQNEIHVKSGKCLIEVEKKIEKNTSDLLAIKEIIESKPIKTNNWDSIRDTFKRPQRVDLDVGS